MAPAERRNPESRVFVTVGGSDVWVVRVEIRLDGITQQVSTKPSIVQSQVVDFPMCAPILCEKGPTHLSQLTGSSISQGVAVRVSLVNHAYILQQFPTQEMGGKKSGPAMDDTAAAANIPYASLPRPLGGLRSPMLSIP